MARRRAFLRRYLPLTARSGQPAPVRSASPSKVGEIAAATRFSRLGAGIRGRRHAALPTNALRRLRALHDRSRRAESSIQKNYRQFVHSLRKILGLPSLGTLEKISAGLVVTGFLFLLIAVGFASNSEPKADASGTVRQSTQQPAAVYGKAVSQKSTNHANKSTATASHRPTPATNEPRCECR